MLTIVRRDNEDSVEKVIFDDKPFWKVSLRRYNFKPMIVPEVRMPDPKTGETTIYHEDGTQMKSNRGK